MTKEEWLQICRLNQEWYYRSVMNNPSDEWIKEHMPDDKVFDDGRIEFFEKNFKKESIDGDKLNELAYQYIRDSYRPYWEEDKEGCSFEEMCTIDYENEIHSFKVGYRKAKEE